MGQQNNSVPEYTYTQFSIHTYPEVWKNFWSNGHQFCLTEAAYLLLGRVDMRQAGDRGYRVIHREPMDP